MADRNGAQYLQTPKALVKPWRGPGRGVCPMTMPDERTRAVVHTAEFLRELTMPSVTPKVPHAVREEARRLLRHYPGRGDMRLAHTVMPQWFGDLPCMSVDPTSRCDQPAQGSAAHGDSQDAVVKEEIRRQAELLPTTLRALGDITPPGSIARAELVARLENLRLHFASPPGSKVA